MDFESFNAKDARKLTEKNNNLELYNLLEKIKEEAEKGGSGYYINVNTNQWIITELKNRGFLITIDRADDDYYYIKW